jgi:hypothetical protein
MKGGRIITNTSQVIEEGLRASPPITVSAASFMGLGLDEWVYIATILYTVLQGSYLVYRNPSNERKTHANENTIY